MKKRKEWKQSQYQNILNSNETQEPDTSKVHSIKTVAKGNTDPYIIDLIRSELGIIDEDANIYNKIMCIAQLGIFRDDEYKVYKTKFIIFIFY